MLHSAEHRLLTSFGQIPPSSVYSVHNVFKQAEKAALKVGVLLVLMYLSSTPGLMSGTFAVSGSACPRHHCHAPGGRDVVLRPDQPDQPRSYMLLSIRLAMMLRQAGLGCCR